MEEVWKPIPNFPKYEVSNLGQVASLDYNGTGRRQIMKQKTTWQGYKDIKLFDKGKRHYFHVHQLVALTFIPNPNNLPCINHKDENKANNRVDNLEWCTYDYNNTYNDLAKRRGLKMRGRERSQEHRVKLRISRNKGYSLRQYTMEGELIGEYYSTLHAQEVTGIRFSTIWACYKGRLKHAGGFIWRREKIEE